MRRCADLSPEVALVLGAEIERCLYHKPQSINGNNPKADEVTAMLREIGFFRMLNFNEPNCSQPPGGLRSFIQMKAGTQGGGQHADSLRRIILGDIVETTELVTEKLIVGLNEAVLNVHQHAYPQDMEPPYAPMPNCRWWIAGYRNSDTREIGFMAYDQGVGIPATLPKKRADLVEDVMRQAAQALQGANPTVDHILIQRAAEGGRSRTGLPSQGHGLADFKKLIGAASGEGSLKILSGRGTYLYADAGVESANPLPVPFHGTLIVWRLAASPAVKWES